MIRFLVIVCLLVSFSCGYFVGRVSLTGAKDIAQAVYVIMKSRLTGTEPTCFDFPDEIWRRMPSCVEDSGGEEYNKPKSAQDSEEDING